MLKALVSISSSIHTENKQKNLFIMPSSSRNVSNRFNHTIIKLLTQGPGRTEQSPSSSPGWQMVGGSLCVSVPLLAPPAVRETETLEQKDTFLEIHGDDISPRSHCYYTDKLEVYLKMQ